MRIKKTGTPGALSTVKARARRKIEEDLRGAPAAVQPHLEAMARGLFAPGFDAAAVAVKPSERREFRFALGVSPKAYHDTLLLDAARWLTCETELPILEIAAALGFGEPEAFSRWFKYRTGLSPMKLRDEARPPAEAVPAPEPERRGQSDDPARSARVWRGLMAGNATAESGQALIRRLLEAYPEAAEEPPDREESR